LGTKKDPKQSFGIFFPKGGGWRMEEKKIQKTKAHNVLLENRKKLVISGVLDVDSFNDEYILIDTELGFLIVRGVTLKIKRLSLESGEIAIDGNICALEYTEDEKSKEKRSSFLSKLFK
jgi:sporulation protein YabP